MTSLFSLSAVAASGCLVSPGDPFSAGGAGPGAAQKQEGGKTISIRSECHDVFDDEVIVTVPTEDSASERPRYIVRGLRSGYFSPAFLEARMRNASPVLQGDADGVPRGQVVGEYTAHVGVDHLERGRLVGEGDDKRLVLLRDVPDEHRVFAVARHFVECLSLLEHGGPAFGAAEWSLAFNMHTNGLPPRYEPGKGDPFFQFSMPLAHTALQLCRGENLDAHREHCRGGELTVRSGEMAMYDHKPGEVWVKTSPPNAGDACEASGVKAKQQEAPTPNNYGTPEVDNPYRNVHPMTLRLTMRAPTP